jgi:hypothetical protein
MEDLSASPPKLGAPIDLVVVFNFDSSKAPPAGPFTQTTLPVYTTATDMPAASIPPPEGADRCQGRVREGRRLHDRVSALPAAGAALARTRRRIPTRSRASSRRRVHGQGADHARSQDHEPRGLGRRGAVRDHVAARRLLLELQRPPAAGARLERAGRRRDGLLSRPLLEHAGGSSLPTFDPKGPSTFDLVFEHGVNPTTDNLLGRDWNGDGIVDATFFLRCRSTKLIVSHTVPADAFNPGEPALRRRSRA